MHVLYDVIPEKISKHFECKALLVGVSFVSVTIYAAVSFLRCMHAAAAAAAAGGGGNVVCGVSDSSLITEY